MTIFPGKDGFRKPYFGLVALFLGVISPLHASESFHHHRYSTGETVRFEFEDSDTVFLAELKDGTVQACDAVS